MKSLFSVQLLLTVSIAIVGCSEREKLETKVSADKPQLTSVNVSTGEQNTPIRTSGPKSEGIDEKQQHMEFLNEMKARPDPVAFLESSWNEIWRPNFDQQWASVDKTTLSQLIDSLESGTEMSFNRILKEGKEPWTRDPESRKSAVTIAAACAEIFSMPPTDKRVHAAELPILLSKYSNQMPPTSGDVMICSMILETSAFFEGRPKIPDGRADAWNQLASSKNPLYRLIALKVFGSFEVSQTQAKKFYSAYLEESEEGINKALVTALSTRNDPWAAETILKAQEKIGPN